MNYLLDIQFFGGRGSKVVTKPKLTNDGRKDDFDALLKVAKEQQKENLKIAQGWGKAEVQWNAYYRKK